MLGLVRKGNYKILVLQNDDYSKLLSIKYLLKDLTNQYLIKIQTHKVCKFFCIPGRTISSSSFLQLGQYQSPSGTPSSLGSRQ